MRKFFEEATIDVLKFEALEATTADSKVSMTVGDTDGDDWE